MSDRSDRSVRWLDELAARLRLEGVISNSEVLSIDGVLLLAESSAGLGERRVLGPASDFPLKRVING